MSTQFSLQPVNSQLPTDSDSGPQPWTEPVDGAALLLGLRDVLSRFVVLPQWAAETLALWTLHTYAFQLRDVSTYIALESPEKRCGKSTLLAVLSRLVHRPVPAANISSPAFFRVIEQAKPTLLIDEADTFLRRNGELRGILNAGYSRETAYVMRVVHQPAGHEHDPAAPLFTGVGDGPTMRSPASQLLGPPKRGDGGSTPHTQLALFSCWCPKIMAAIGHFPDTLADRCIVIRMQRKTSHEQCERLRSLDAQPLRRQCARFVSDHADDIASARPQVPQGLTDRAADIWEPLLALADLAGGEWPELARQAATGLTAASQDSNPIASLLFDILYLFALGQQERMFTRDLVGSLNLGFADRPWRALLKGKNVTDMWLAQKLQPYGIRPRTIWIGDTQAKGYLQDDFSESFRRYIPRSELDALRSAHTKPSHPSSSSADTPPPD